MKRLLLAVALLFPTLSPVAAQEVPPASDATASWQWRDAEMSDGSRVRFAVVLPDGFDASRTYPVMLALPGGDQSAPALERSLRRFLYPEAKRRGWVVISPLSNRGQMMVGGAARHAGALIDLISKEIQVEGGKVHVVGIEGGGRQAFRAALEHPGRVASVVGLPGAIDNPQGMMRAHTLRDVKVRLLVSDQDLGTINLARDTVGTLTKEGGDARLFELVGESAALESVTSVMVMNLLDGLRPGAVSADDVLQSRLAGLTPEGRAVGQVLDELHAAAAAADGARYFALFADNAVFLGTDATERWTIAQFKAYAEPIFAKGRGWSYTPIDREITISADRRVAWFDERLEAPHMGECRGTGVLVLTGEQWKIAQYNLTVPIPNDLAKEFVERIRRHGEGGKPE